MALSEELLQIYYAREQEQRDRSSFEYASDILRDPNVAFPNAIWNLPNLVVVQIIAEQLDWDSLPMDEEDRANAISQGILFPNQENFARRHEGEQALCEAQNHQPCLLGICPLYFNKTNPPICREFKMAFRRTPVTH